MRIEPRQEDIFFDHIKILIENLFINNKNFTNGWYYTKGVSELIKDNKERATWILDEMQRTKHLIGIEDDEGHQHKF